MQRTHFKDESGEDHIVHYVRWVDEAGKFFVQFTCCKKILCVTPEEFAMSYSVHQDAPESHG